MRKKETTLTFKKIELRANPNSALGMVLDYLKASKVDHKAILAELLLARYLPLVLDKNSLEYQEKTLNSINTMRSWIETIQQFSEIQTQNKDIPDISNANTEEEIAEEVEESEEANDSLNTVEIMEKSLSFLD